MTVENETLSTTPEQQTEEKTTEEQFYGKTSEDTEVENTDEIAAESEESKDEEVASSEDVQDEDSTGKEDEGQQDKEEEWSLELPENSLVSEASMKEIESFAKENSLSKEAATKLLERENSAVQNFIDKQEQELNNQLDQWREEVINDPTIGGENLKLTTERARRVVQEFGSQEFIDILNDTGYGDNIEVVRFLSKIGKQMSEDTLVTPGTKRENKSTEELFYGSNN